MRHVLRSFQPWVQSCWLSVRKEEHELKDFGRKAEGTMPEVGSGAFLPDLGFFA